MTMVTTDIPQGNRYQLFPTDIRQYSLCFLHFTWWTDQDRFPKCCVLLTVIRIFKFKYISESHFFSWLNSYNGPRPPKWGSWTTPRYTTDGGTPMDVGSPRRRDLYLTIHSTHKRHPYFRRDSNPKSQQGSGRSSTLSILWPLGSVSEFMAIRNHQYS